MNIAIPGISRRRDKIILDKFSIAYILDIVYQQSNVYKSQGNEIIGEN